MRTSSYMLGKGNQAEFRLELLNELTSQLFIAEINKLHSKNVRVLNLGCGSGHLEEKLAHIFSESHFVGLDISEDRIKEARQRIHKITSTNTFEFIQSDLTTHSIENLKPCDILISRFVLSHLPNSIQQLERYLPLVKPGGYICIEELAGDGIELYCNTENNGYRTFKKIVQLQTRMQKSSFHTGFKLLSKLLKSKHEIIHYHLSQPILNNARHKSILRLGIEEARPNLKEFFEDKIIKKSITSLKQFESDLQAFGLYSRFLTVIAKIK